MASQQFGYSRWNNTEMAGFLKQCSHCNRMIDSKSDIFMVGDLRGFCSIECRDKQLAQDKAAKGKGKSSNSK
ncbi:FCS-Like Zinc finger 3-like [Salvia divinorum]|uniref:FCS-Like Zinc finger 3-like n=1 Tax=Salvia divinorum TaxID=28513 RepID=A0ABD1H187_SALDI